MHTSMTALPSDLKVQTVARKPAAVTIFLSGQARNVLDRRVIWFEFSNLFVIIIRNIATAALSTKKKTVSNEPVD